jgi:hypothetical protein
VRPFGAFFRTPPKWFPSEAFRQDRMCILFANIL